MKPMTDLEALYWLSHELNQYEYILATNPYNSGGGCYIMEADLYGKNLSISLESVALCQTHGDRPFSRDVFVESESCECYGENAGVLFQMWNDMKEDEIQLSTPWSIATDEDAVRMVAMVMRFLTDNDMGTDYFNNTDETPTDLASEVLAYVVEHFR